MSSDDLRSAIARRTASTKLAVIRSSAESLNQLLRTAQVEQDEISDPWECLCAKATTLKDMQLPQTDRLRRIASDALAFIWTQERYTLKRSTKQLQRWNDRLDEQLRYLKRRMEHAVAFADVIEEFIAKDSHDRRPPLNRESPVLTVSPLDLPPLPPQNFDPEAYLTSQNARPELLEGVAALRRRATTFGQGQLKCTIHPQKVKSAMLTLARDARVYSADIRKQLVEESGKPLVLSELAGALTQTWRSISTWQWPAEGVVQVPHTHLNGKQRAFLQIDIVLAILLQLIGDTWSAFYKVELETLRQNEGWPFRAELQGAMTAEEEEDVRRQLELINLEDPLGKMRRGQFSDSGIVAARRQAFMKQGSQIFGSAYDGESSYDGGEAISKQPEDPFASLLDSVRPAKAYGDIFRLITTDIVLARNVAPSSDLTILHGDLQDYGQSVPHDVLLSTLSFFGMPPAWIQWYTTYLRVPLVQSNGTIQISTRGTPFGQSCSTLADELLLVILDIALASTTNITAHRNHDDFWLWDLDREKMEHAWQIMQDFTARTGLGWNGTKTSCTVVKGTNSDEVTASTLPSRRLRWGILELGANGKWKIDPQLVDEQADAAVSEIQSGQSGSFLGKIGVVNKYQAYLIRNSGAPTGFNVCEYLEIVRQVLTQFEERLTNGMGLDQLLHKLYIESFPNAEETDAHEVIRIWPLRLGGFGFQSFAPLALAYKQHSDSTDSVNEENQARAGPDLSPRRRTYEKMQEIWASPALSDTFYNSRHSDGALGRWIRSKSKLPQLVTIDTYAKWWIMHGSLNLAVIQDTTAQISLQAIDVAKQASGLYKALLEEDFGEGEGLVPKDLVPNYAILDVEQRVKKLFS
ncbi:hypothetical protein NliqN6_6882 [Naganishia liquefaciens]|uniref:Reverse transcriptase domain-containing protein n=1 Tax=Naganishia liquefaciens TaxID=104408 RepID=A0A8H3U0V1_9TREE|nr:hypothetical protein NliqN6_6882 [Naganishia liquefaciens]